MKSLQEVKEAREKYHAKVKELTGKEH